jgi:hypothetical protein
MGTRGDYLVGITSGNWQLTSDDTQGATSVVFGHWGVKTRCISKETIMLRSRFRSYKMLSFLTYPELAHPYCRT